MTTECERAFPEDHAPTLLESAYPNLEALADGRIGLNERLSDYVALRTEASVALAALKRQCPFAVLFCKHLNERLCDAGKICSTVEISNFSP